MLLPSWHLRICFWACENKIWFPMSQYWRNSVKFPSSAEEGTWSTCLCPRVHHRPESAGVQLPTRSILVTRYHYELSRAPNLSGTSCGKLCVEVLYQLTVTDIWQPPELNTGTIHHLRSDSSITLFWVTWLSCCCSGSRIYSACWPRHSSLGHWCSWFRGITSPTLSTKD